MIPATTTRVQENTANPSMLDFVGKGRERINLHRALDGLLEANARFDCVTWNGAGRICQSAFLRTSWYRRRFSIATCDSGMVPQSLYSGP